MPYNFANSALPPYDESGKRVPEDVWKFQRQQRWMKAMKYKIEGLDVPDIAIEMSCSTRSIYQYLTLARKAIKEGNITEDQIFELGQLSVPVDIQRRRLLRRLRKSDEVIGQAMEDYDRSEPALAVNATRTALAINKGLGVLKEETKSTKITFEEKRLIISAQLGLAEQYGAKVSEEIKAEVIDSDDSPMNVKRETKD